jgi:heme-degrading monooxygenase HmoA
MYISMSHLRVAEERVAELITAFRGRAGLVEQAEGFIDLEVWASDRDPGEVVMVSRWRDRECFKQYMRSGAHRTSHDRIAPELKAAIKLARLDHMRSYEVVAR